jgi:hypothetical protein
MVARAVTYNDPRFPGTQTLGNADDLGFHLWMVWDKETMRVTRDGMIAIDGDVALHHPEEFRGAARFPRPRDPERRID